MSDTTLTRSRPTSEAAERQMRKWALQMEAQRRREERDAAAAPPQSIRPYVAVSREAGVDAGEIAEVLASRLGWKLFDRELLDYMAEHCHWSRVALEYVDERTASWFHETFGKWLDEQLVSQAEYVSSLGRVVLMAAQHESVVFVGRGAQFLLPAESGLSVRLVAPIEQRIKRIMERRKCKRHDAETFIHQTDDGRADFVRRYFHRDVSDPHLYDLVINLARTPRAAVDDIILAAVRLRFGDAGKANPTD